MSSVDEKGRITIPSETMTLLGIKPGDTLFFQVQGDKIIIRKSISMEEFIKLSEEFSQKLGQATKEPIKFKKMFE